MKGAVDDLDMVIETLEKNGFKDRFYIHCDGALFGLMMPFVKRVWFFNYLFCYYHIYPFLWSNWLLTVISSDLDFLFTAFILFHISIYPVCILRTSGILGQILHEFWFCTKLPYFFLGENIHALYAQLSCLMAVKICCPVRMWHVLEKFVHMYLIHILYFHLSPVFNGW